MKYICYTDGSSRGNPGAGGWACIVIGEEEVKEFSGRAEVATNNQMEMSGLIFALEFVAKNCDEGDVAEIHSDSEYSVKGYNDWLKNWEKNNWRNSQKKPVLNKELWQTILVLKNTILSKGIDAKIKHVYGHNGHIYNERADLLCTSAALQNEIELYNGTKREYELFLNNS